MAIHILHWTSHNKMLVFFAFSTFCLLISTIALAQKRAGLCTVQTGFKNEQAIGFIQHVNEDEFVYGKEYYRLPKNVKPTHYDIYLSPSITNKTFEGTATITLSVLEKTKIITLHSNKLTINSVILKNADSNISIQATELVKDKRELLYVKIKSKIPEGNYKLSIKFEGRLDNGIVGFYSSSLKNGG